MENSYWNRKGRHQDVVERLDGLMPDIGYTGKRWLNAFICLSNLYYDYYNNGGGNIKDCYMESVEAYIRPLFPIFDIAAFMGDDDERVERQMDIVLTVMKAVDPREFQADFWSIWADERTEELSRQAPEGAGQGKDCFSVTFGNEKDFREWCDARCSVFGWKMKEE